MSLSFFAAVEKFIGDMMKMKNVSQSGGHHMWGTTGKKDGRDKRKKEVEVACLGEVSADGGKHEAR